MPDRPRAKLLYCCNATAGATLAQVREGIARHAVAARALLAEPGPLPLGLWLSATTAHALSADSGGPRGMREWLGEQGLEVASLNGFPYGDFHGPVVKHAVYEPTWADARRMLYTTQLADLLVDLLPEGVREGSISTLPLGWKLRMCMERQGAGLGIASAQLSQVARHLARIEAERGVTLHLDLEPEPGCFLERSRDVVEFFGRAAALHGNEAEFRRHIRVCHDVCHAAVMFEPQEEAIEAYRAAGIRVGKVQLSSALECDGSKRAFHMLRNFDEPRWLHQTCALDGAGEVHFFEDLDRAFEQAPEGVWRTHFHVPIHLESVGALATTQRDIGRCLAAVRPEDGVRHFEVETYAWSAMPMDCRGASHAESMAAELRWARAALQAHGHG